MSLTTFNFITENTGKPAFRLMFTRLAQAITQPARDYYCTCVHYLEDLINVIAVIIQ